jgi:hypothetical protein
MGDHCRRVQAFTEDEHFFTTGAFANRFRARNSIARLLDCLLIPMKPNVTQHHNRSQVRRLSASMR